MFVTMADLGQQSPLIAQATALEVAAAAMPGSSGDGLRQIAQTLRQANNQDPRALNQQADLLEVQATVMDNASAGSGDAARAAAAQLRELANLAAHGAPPSDDKILGLPKAAWGLGALALAIGGGIYLWRQV